MRRKPGEPEASLLAQLQTPREKLVGWLQCAVFWLSIPVLFFGTLTLFHLDDQLQRGAEYTVDETGETAYVRECAEYGPISHAGFGYHWSCSIDYKRTGLAVRPERKETLRSVFTPADIGMTFAVKKSGKHFYRHHHDNPYPWAHVLLVFPLALVIFVLIYALSKRRWPDWAKGSLTARIRANPAVGDRFIEQLLRQGRLVARRYAPARAPKPASSVEIAGRDGHRIYLTKSGIADKRHDAPVWSVRWAQVEKVELTAFHRADDWTGEHPIARVMDIYTIPREWASREPGLKEHWGTWGIQGGARIGYFLSQEKATAIHSMVTNRQETSR
ncbi:DUF6346 domain-containing protein [Amycolatopsis albispora]|uniref:Uncharacterized protein n=1 Tax=Amycolatopsis albispora TaxID=1804986 RepID=A0A344LF69_9PSEU|nr:DUF6346 domain-containing protein [Amycolatopsis albispora]AXB46693.1 hypothetical protein A4R43_33160 [Amycolatopsis albispora]